MKKNLLIISLLLISFVVYSQHKKGIGNVVNTMGEIVPNAIVQISPNSSSSVIYEYVCDKNGNYTFDFYSNDSVFQLNILPSIQSLQFTHTQESINLWNGNNGIIKHTVIPVVNNGIKLTVVDTLGNPVVGAKVVFYDTKRKWRIDSCRMIAPVFTDINGQVTVNSLLSQKYFFNVRKAYLTNRFTVMDTVNDVSTITNVSVEIRDLTQKEFLMSGLCDNKTWITDSMVIFGVSSPYDADSKLISDGTWWDSNDNHGYWWFNSDETGMTYDYDDDSQNGSGSTVDATLVELTDSTFVGDMTMLGMPVTYYMSAQYDTIDLAVNAKDTLLYLDANGLASISTDQLFMESEYCFTCDTIISQTTFNSSDIGTKEVYVTMTDRCGNTDTDTMLVTIAAMPTSLDLPSQNHFKLFPNPTSDIVSIESADVKMDYIELVAIDGKLVQSQIVNNERFSMDLSNLGKGVYFIRIYTHTGLTVKQLIVR